MFDTILIPVDESDRTRDVLTAVRPLLRRQDAKVTLLRVLVPLLERPSEREGRVDDEQRHLSLRKNEAERQLAALAAELTAEGVRAEHKVALGDPAGVILDEIERTRPALVAMGTHGRRGPARWIRGSVAERVLRRSPQPLLLVNPTSAEQAGRRFGRILVPLDGSATSAAILPLATEFARQHQAELVLMRVNDLPLGDYATPAVLSTQRLEGLQRWLDEQRAALAKEGLQVSTVSSLGDPAGEILDAAEREKVDLVAMTTHGSSGLERWLFGSVAENVLRSCRVPVLVKRSVPAAPQ